MLRNHTKDIGEKPIGLNITAPGVLQKHHSNLAGDRICDFWTQLATSLSTSGFEVALFTNGASEDHAFAHIVASRFPQAKSSVRLMSRPLHPRQLVQQIAGFRAVVAHRLHANIVSHALCIPNVALVWDTKVEQFAHSTGRVKFCIRPEDIAVDAVRATLEEAIRAGVDSTRLDILRHVALSCIQETLANR